MSLDELLLLPNGKLKLLPAAAYDKCDRQEIRIFCHHTGRYGLPTEEVVGYIKGLINGRSAIEIGSGNGDLGYHLGIPMTDSKMQTDNPLASLHYFMMGQPAIDYPPDVEKIEALDAVLKYKPQVVVASWVTQWVPPIPLPPGSGSIYGVKEDKLLDLVESYILVGNTKIHSKKEICKLPHEEIALPGLRSRASYPESDRIYIWNKQ